MAIPSVSICVPTYQGQAYLRECLESIAAQTLRDFEVIIVDDNSADRSLEIISDFVNRDQRFHVHRNPIRLGLVRNWNRALELSQGTWIKLLFQDDLIAPDCLERLVQGCVVGGRPFAFCRRHLLFDEHTAAETKSSYVNHEALLDAVYGNREYLDAESFAACYAERQGWNLIGEPTATLFHRSMLKEFGTFDPGLVQLCDAEYWTRLATNVGVVHIADRLATFRIHGASTTAHNASQRAFRMRTVDPLILRYLILRKPYYRKLRSTLFPEGGRAAALLYFTERVYDAGKSAVSGSDESFSRGCWLEWKNVLSSYPELKVFSFVGWARARLRAVWHGLRLDRRVRRPPAVNYAKAETGSDPNLARTENENGR